MSNTKNMILAVVVVVTFVALWDAFVLRRYGSPKRPPQGTAESIGPTTRSVVESPATTEGLSPQMSEKINPPTVDRRAQEIVLKTSHNEVTFNSYGARVVSWKVKERDSWIELVTTPEEEIKEFIYPLQTLPLINFAVLNQTDKSVTFQADSLGGLSVKKQFDFGETPWLHHFSLTVTNKSNYPQTLPGGIGWGQGLTKLSLDKEIGKKEKVTIKAEMRGVALADKIMSWKPGILFGKTIDKTVTGTFRWVGVDNAHFLAAFIPVRRGSQVSYFDQLKVKSNKKLPPIIEIPISDVRPNESQTQEFQLYVGPKIMSVLAAAGSGLEQSVEFGFFGIISKILLKGLRFFQSITGNYGWAIIILTICVQILFFPLTRKTLQHSLKMKVLQPQLKKIQKELKHDPKRLQIETFNLYRKNGMKFMGMEGCFPMLIQIPIFFAFYQTLRVAYELRGAPWIFWITDLAVFDPYFILPVVMGLGMFLQQKVTSVAMDPTQAKMMFIMPIMFTFFFLKLPAGLVLYWVVNSLTTVMVQKILQWQKKSGLNPSKT